MPRLLSGGTALVVVRLRARIGGLVAAVLPVRRRVSVLALAARDLGHGSAVLAPRRGRVRHRAHVLAVLRGARGPPWLGAVVLVRQVDPDRAERREHGPRELDAGVSEADHRAGE